MPFAVMEGDVPFSHLIEVEDPGEHCRFSLHAGLEQLSAAMVDSEEIEVKAGIDLNAFAAREQKGSFLTDIREKELDLARIQEMPGIVGYLVQEGDHPLGHCQGLSYHTGEDPGMESAGNGGSASRNQAPHPEKYSFFEVLTLEKTSIILILVQ